MRRRGRTDSNQREIVAALRKAGATVQVLSSVGDGCPDILVGHRSKNYLLEIKDGTAPPSQRKLTPDEQNWHDAWAGSVQTVHSLWEALGTLGIKTVPE